MELHRVTIDSAWRPDHRGIRHRRYLARCICGWSPGWLPTRHDAADQGDDHRAMAAAGARRARTPDPAA